MVEFNTGWEYISKNFGKSIKEAFLTFIGLLIPIAGFLAVYGWIIEILSNTIKGSDEIPSVFDDFGDKIMSGLMIILFALILVLIASIIIAPVSFLMKYIIRPISFSIGNENIALLLSIILFIITFLMQVVIGLISTPLLCNYAEKKEFNAFFEISKAWKIIKENFVSLIISYLIIMVYGFGLFIIMAVLMFTAVGIIFIPVVMIMWLMIIAKIIGSWYAESTRTRSKKTRQKPETQSRTRPPTQL